MISLNTYPFHAVIFFPSLQLSERLGYKPMQPLHYYIRTQKEFSYHINLLFMCLTMATLCSNWVHINGLALHM